MKSLMGLVQQAPCRIDIEFKSETGGPYRKTATVKGKGTDVEELMLYTNKDTIQGEVRVMPSTARRFEHQGVKVQLVGQIELASERGQFHDFVSLDRNLAPPGDMNATAILPFEFRSVEMMYDSYRGQNVRCRYFLRVLVVGKGMVPDTKREAPFWVRNYDVAAEASTIPIKMEVGIEDCLHIEFEYDKAKYHLKDVVVGKIYFLLVRIKLKHMELEIRRRETTGAGVSAHSDSETLAKYEIMDGAPVRGESIPIRLYLSPYELSPSYKEVHNKYSVRYYLNLVLVDEEDRRYFKQQEITLYRQADVTSVPGNMTARLPSNAGRVFGSPDMVASGTGAGGTPTTSHGGGSKAVTSPTGLPLGSFDEGAGSSSAFADGGGGGLGGQQGGRSSKHDLTFGDADEQDSHSPLMKGSLPSAREGGLPL